MQNFLVFESLSNLAIQWNSWFSFLLGQTISSNDEGFLIKTSGLDNFLYSPNSRLCKKTQG